MSRNTRYVSGKTSRVLVRGTIPTLIKKGTVVNVDVDIVMKVAYGAVPVEAAKALESALEEGFQLDLATWYRSGPKVPRTDPLQVGRNEVGADDALVGERREPERRDWNEPDDLGPVWEDTETPAPPAEGEGG